MPQVLVGESRPGRPPGSASSGASPCPPRTTPPATSSPGTSLWRRKDDPGEPIRLLEVDAAALSSVHIEPFLFGGAGGIPYPMLIAAVTPSDLERLRASLVGTEWDLSKAERHLRPAA